MAVLVLDESACETLLAQRRAMGGDRYDEVWEGTYVMNPLASVEHQRLVMGLARVLDEVVRGGRRGLVLPGANVAESADDWEQNYRCPDVVVVLSGGRAVDIGPALVGGPDFLVEIRSPQEKTVEKLTFYEKIGVRELLVVDRDSKALELFTLADGKLQLQGQSHTDAGRALSSAVLGLEFAAVVVDGEPSVRVLRTGADNAEWII